MFIWFVYFDWKSSFKDEREANCTSFVCIVIELTNINAVEIASLLFEVMTFMLWTISRTIFSRKNSKILQNHQSTYQVLFNAKFTLLFLNGSWYKINSTRRRRRRKKEKLVKTKVELFNLTDEKKTIETFLQHFQYFCFDVIHWSWNQYL